MDYHQGHVDGASKAINNFISELCQTFNLQETDKEGGQSGSTPTERKEHTIKCLVDLMQDVAEYYYKVGAHVGARELLRMQRDAGVENRRENISRRDWKSTVSHASVEAANKYRDSDEPW